MKFERVALDTDAGQLLGIVAGAADGPPVLAVHGWGSEVDLFAPLIHSCTRRGLRVYAFDMPVHGLTRGANPNKHTSTLAEWTETLLALPRLLGIEEWQSVIAHSFGGLASAFAIGPRPWSGSPPLRTKTLSLIASSSGMPAVIDAYAVANACSPADVLDIIRGVEAAACAALPTLTIGAIVDHLPGRILLAHDPQDSVASLDALRTQLAAHPHHEELLRPGAGHDGILLQLEVGRTVAQFAAGPA